MAHHVTYKMPRARKESRFTVYPFSKGDLKIQLQSDNHCMIVLVERGKTLVSKRFAQYPTFAACHPGHGGKVIDTPKEIQEQVEEIMKTPTGRIVTL